jgi:hypothetical protein
MNEYDNITLTGTFQATELTRTISKLEKDVMNLHAMVTTMQGDTLALRAQVAHEMAVGQILREYIEYLNPPDGERPKRPMSYADWLKMQGVNEQILAARAAA